MNETQEQLLAATRTCINQRGLAATTSRDITGTAGVNLAAITYHFGSKDRLVADALLSSLREWLEPTLDVLRSDADQTTRTMLAVQTLLATFEAHRDQVGVYLEAMSQAPRIDAVGDGLIELWTELRSLLAAQIQQMRGDDDLPAWVDAQAMAGLLVAVANGLVMHVAIDPDGPTLAAMAGQFSALLLAARSS